MADDQWVTELQKLKVSELKYRHVVLGALAVIGVWSSWFTVATEEAGVVKRLGEYVRTVDPGLNLKLPFGLETVTKVPVQRQLKDEFGFRTLQPGIQTQYAPNEYEDESVMLTGDLNAADVEWIVQYRIDDPYKYLFRVRRTRQTFRDLNEATMRQVVGDRTVSEVLTVGRQEIADAVEQQLQALSDQYEMGIHVEQVVLQDVNPPDEVKPAFNEVNEAQQEREQLINQARGEYNRVIPKARGEAARAIEAARGYAIERVNEARGDSARFVAVYEEFAQAEEVTWQRIYLETMDAVLQQVGRKLITDEGSAGILPLFRATEGDLR